MLSGWTEEYRGVLLSMHTLSQLFATVLIKIIISVSITVFCLSIALFIGGTTDERAARNMYDQIRHKPSPSAHLPPQVGQALHLLYS